MDQREPDQRDRNEAEWADPANWWGGFYRSPRDTRVFVPKRVRWAGWTLNFAHRAAYRWLAALLMVPLAVGLLAVAIATLG